MKPATEGWVDAPTRIEPAQKELSDGGDDLSELIGQQIGNYVVERPLGRGGMAVVYLARHPALGREVAVKLLSPEYKSDVDLNARFLQEARVTANFRHPNIVEIYDLGDIGGRAYYTMERLIGTDLASQVSKRERVQPRARSPSTSCRSVGRSTWRTSKASCIAISNPPTSSWSTRSRCTSS